MSKLYRTVENTVSAEFEEKKSRFIGHITHVTTEEEAAAFIKSKQKEFHDATHNVFAYKLKGGMVARYSDDGEPTGTSGMPTLDTINKSELEDVCIVVTRYFGGTLLGASGLVRAYSKAASLAISAARIATYEEFAEFFLSCSYSDYQKVQSEFAKYGVKVDKSDFSDSVFLNLAIKKGSVEAFFKRVAEITSNRAAVNITGERLDK